jgi:hypothetical protein
MFGSELLKVKKPLFPPAVKVAVRCKSPKGALDPTFAHEALILAN